MRKEVKSKTISLRSTEEEYELWTELAEKGGFTLGEWIRNQCKISTNKTSLKGIVLDLQKRVLVMEEELLITVEKDK